MGANTASSLNSLLPRPMSIVSDLLVYCSCAPALVAVTWPSLLTPFPWHVTKLGIFPFGCITTQIGAYAQILSADPNMTQIVSQVILTGLGMHVPWPYLIASTGLQNPYLEDLLKQPGDKPVLHIALMPAEGLANVTLEVAERVADKMASINAQGVTVWL